ncbi:hypothetical protein BD311DRAFT_806770 [Dichomitus squalens]|uniref:Uncharacterized protein n=1 Tax=Dichomitus squalens TaxID=114155 RepID=A0A4Q9MMN8_9APHY|nr:hypothetical protein BD311DRAFT_806770 [Dichomitus squalens]
MVPAGPQMTDADDSIVLAGLVRTGEASRLRRRGAIRLDHNAGGIGRALLGDNPGPSSYAPPVRPVIIEPSRTPSPEPDADGVGADEYTYTTGPASRGWDGSIRPAPGRGAEGMQAVEILSASTQAGQAFILYCSSKDASVAEYNEPTRREPSPLRDLSSPSRQSSSR